MDAAITVPDFKDICRFCLQFASEKNPQFPLFLHQGQYGRYSKNCNESLPELIASCLGMKVEPDDGLPLNVCTMCEEALLSSNAFRAQCFRSLQTLLEIKQRDEKEISQLEPHFEIEEEELPLKRRTRHSDEHIKIEEEQILQEEFVEYTEVPEDPEPELDVNNDSNDEDYEPIDEDDPDDDEEGEELSEPKYEMLQIEKVTPEPATTPVAPKPATKLYGSIKRPLKTIPKSEIATPSSSRKSVANTSAESMDIDSSFDLAQSADDSGAQEDANASSAPKKRQRSHLPKQCYVCGLIVTRMRDHMKSHPGELQYKCEHCPRSYLTKTGRDRHMDGQHPETRTKSTPVVEKRAHEKLKRQRGEAYVSKSGQAHSARRMKPRCKNCRFECDTVTDAEREQLFAEYYALGDIHLQWQYIARSVSTVQAKFPRKNSMKKRTCTYAYAFRMDGGKRMVRVCKLFFMNTLAISNQVNKSAQSKCNEMGELVVRDRRGHMRHKRKNSISADKTTSTEASLVSAPNITSTNVDIKIE